MPERRVLEFRFPEYFNSSINTETIFFLISLSQFKMFVDIIPPFFNFKILWNKVSWSRRFCYKSCTLKLAHWPGVASAPDSTQIPQMMDVINESCIIALSPVNKPYAKTLQNLLILLHSFSFPACHCHLSIMQECMNATLGDRNCMVMMQMEYQCAFINKLDALRREPMQSLCW